MKNSETAGMLLIVYLFVISVFILPLSLWTWRSLDFWLELAKGGPVDTPYWMAFLLTCLAPFTVLANLITEVVRLAM